MFAIGFAPQHSWLEGQSALAKQTLTSASDKLHQIAKYLLEYETVESADFKDSLVGLLNPVPSSIEEPKKKKRRKSNPPPLGSIDPVPIK